MINNETLYFPYQNYPCRIKGCANKKKNGRCFKTYITFGLVYPDNTLDFNHCLSFESHKEYEVRMNEIEKEIREWVNG